MAATQALKEMIESGVSPSEMTKLVVGVPPPTLRMIDHGVVFGDRASHLTSVGYQMALAAFAPEGALDVKEAPKAISDKISIFMSRVTVRSHQDLLGHYPKSWPARLVVSFPLGRQEKLVLHVPGDPERPFDEPQVSKKFRRGTAPISGKPGANAPLSRRLAVLGGSPNALLPGVERPCVEGSRELREHPDSRLSPTQYPSPDVVRARRGVHHL